MRSIVAPFVVTQRGKGNNLAFRLARAIKLRQLTLTEIDRIFHEWFEKSHSMLPPDADEHESLQTFYRQLKRVRLLRPA